MGPRLFYELATALQEVAARCLECHKVFVVRAVFNSC